jgi:RNA polymerase sigma-70 factor (ECF subfamily)
MEKDPSAELLARWREGDRRAADELLGRYTSRLIALARRRLSAKLARRLDPEDVVQSAYRSFCVSAGDDRYRIERSGDLWRLLAAITLHKLHHQIEHHTAAKRSIKREQGFGGESSLMRIDGGAEGAEPSPLEAATLVEEVEHLMSELKPLDRRMVELRLQGFRLEEIALATDRSERWVRRVLSQVKERLDRRHQKLSNSTT